MDKDLKETIMLEKAASNNSSQDVGERMQSNGPPKQAKIEIKM